jgi:succinate dehydrogenase / fumarate reductase cytochrome b subunit
MTSTARKRRREFRNIHVTQILKYRLPLPGIMSILHRISGAVMFLMLPVFVYLLDLSLTSELSYAQLLDLADLTIVKIVFCGLAFAFIHHFWGGIRHLVNDMHIGIDKEAAPKMARVFLGLSLATTALACLAIFGVI